LNVRVAPRNDSGGLVPPVVFVLLFFAGVFVLLAMVLMWAGAQVPTG
jgi:hypothetical protein